MARYDVFLVSTVADREKAELIARRLRALKFKVRLDKKREHTTPTPRDYRDADNSQSVLVLWSKSACDTSNSDSDWVHAIAHHARSKPGVLLQSGLDKTVPDEPFNNDKRFTLTGMGPRKLVGGYYDLVDELGRRDGRKDLRAWIDLKTSDKDGKAAWLDAHPTDPLAAVKKPAAKKTVAVAPAPAEKAETRIAPPPLKMTPPVPPQPQGLDIGMIMLGAVGFVILAMLVMSASLRTQAGLPAAAGAGAMLQECPAGQMPEYLLDETSRGTLEPGPITDDTSGD